VLWAVEPLDREGWWFTRASRSRRQRQSPSNCRKLRVVVELSSRADAWRRSCFTGRANSVCPWSAWRADRLTRRSSRWRPTRPIETMRGGWRIWLALASSSQHRRGQSSARQRRGLSRRGQGRSRSVLGAGARGRNHQGSRHPRPVRLDLRANHARSPDAGREVKGAAGA
jgi:hypothetical protein